MKYLAAALVLLAGPALAADALAPYAPITISEQDYKALEAYLGEQPMKFSGPIAQWLAVAETRAVKQAADDKASDGQPKQAPSKAPPPESR